MFLHKTVYMCNLPSLHVVVKARHLSSSAFCNFHRLGVPEQALEIPVGFGIVVEDKILTCSFDRYMYV